MKKIIVSGIMSMLLIGCTQVNTSGEKTIKQGDDTVSEVNISLSKYDAISELSEIEDAQTLLFRASGTEPGWFAEFYNNKLRVVVDYGKDSLVLENQTFEGLDDPKGFIFNQRDKNNIEIRINNLTCVAPGNGNKEDRAVLVTYKGKAYKGCGSFIK